MKRSLLLIVLVLLVGVSVWTLTLQKNPSPIKTETLTVTASFYPLVFFAEQIGGSHVRVTNLTPVGAEPHDVEPTAEDIITVYQSNLFLYNGGGVDAWASKIAPSIRQQGITVIEMSTYVGDLIPPIEGREEGMQESFDEHYWLDPHYAIKEVETIRDKFKQLDPTHTDEYQQNAALLIQKLERLDKEYREGLSSCQKPIAITSHAAFGYLAKRYGFKQVPITGISPEDEPSAGTLADIATLAKQNQVTYIFFETLVNPKLAQTLANEIGAKTLVFNPIEGLTQLDVVSGSDYFSIAHQNLINLRQAMLCQ